MNKNNADVQNEYRFNLVGDDRAIIREWSDGRVTGCVEWSANDSGDEGEDAEYSSVIDAVQGEFGFAVEMIEAALPEVPVAAAAKQIAEIRANMADALTITTVFHSIMTTSEVEAEFGLADGTAKKAAQRGQVIARKAGDAWLISRASAEQTWGGKRHQQAG